MKMRMRWVVTMLAVLVALSGCKFDGAYDLPLPGAAVDEEDGYSVTVEFADALNVVPRTAVMVDDVVVGQVQEVERKGWHAQVEILVRKDIDLPENAVAEVRQTSLLGEKYIALLDPPNGTATTARLSDGDLIPLSATGRNPEVEEVLGALATLLSGGGVGQLKTIAVELNKMLDGRTDTARNVLAEMNLLVGTLDDQKSNIITAMDSINRLTATLNKEKGTFEGALDALGPALKVLNEQHATLIKMLKELDKLGVVGTRVLNGSRDNIVSSLRHLRPVLRKLNEAGDALPRGLALLASFPFPKEAADIAKGDYANALFNIEIDLNKVLKSPDQVLPSIVGLCSTTPLDPVCQVLDETLLAQICPQLPVNSPLCDDPGPLVEGLTDNPLAELFGGSGSTSGGSGTRPGSGSGSGSGLGGLLGGLL